MLTIDLITDYLTHRRKGVSPSTALHWAREGDAEALADRCEETAFDSGVFAFDSDDLPDGWTCLITITADDDPDLSWIGEMTGDGPRPDILSGCVNHAYREGGRCGWHSFKPANSYASTRKWYADHGYSRHDADCHAKRQSLEDYRRFIDYGNGWHSVQWLAEVREAGGNVVDFDSCCGIESDSDYCLRDAADNADLLCKRLAAAHYADVPQR